jgi:hypothetical protein
MFSGWFVDAITQLVIQLTSRLTIISKTVSSPGQFAAESGIVRRERESALVARLMVMDSVFCFMYGLFLIHPRFRSTLQLSSIQFKAKLTWSSVI